MNAVSVLQITKSLVSVQAAWPKMPKYTKTYVPPAGIRITYSFIYEIGSEHMKD